VTSYWVTLVTLRHPLIYADNNLRLPSSVCTR